MTGGPGYRPLHGLSGDWKDDYNGYAGLGVSKSLGSSMLLDLGIDYQFFTPLNSPLQAFEARAGLVWPFGNDQPNRGHSNNN